MPEPEGKFVTEIHPDKVVTVLAVTQASARELESFFKRSNWVLHCVRTCEQALHFLNRCPVPVVICERDLPDGFWTDLLSRLEELEHPPVLIVTSSNADESLWAEVLNLGGYDVLPQPFERSEVVRVVSLAWMHWRNVYRRTSETPIRTFSAIA